MTGALLALVLTALPQGRADYRMELGGTLVGRVTIELRCQAAACTVRWESRQRLPAEVGGGLLERRVELDVDLEGRSLGPARITEGGVARAVILPTGSVPSLLVEPALAPRLASAGPACLDTIDELTGATRRACGRLEGGRMRIELGPELEWVRTGVDGFADEVELPGQRIRFVRDRRATVPSRPPRLYGVEVDGPADPARAARFCGLVRDPPPPDLPETLPAPRADGTACQEQTAAWLSRARAGGWRGRTAVGVAWSGAAWSWHAWAEVQVAGRWVPVDPSFGQAPARSARFTLATWNEGDEPGRAEAGRRILRCWGRSRVEE